MKPEFCARANARAKFWTPLPQNPESAPELAGWVSQVGSGVETSSHPRPKRNVRKVWASDLHFSYSSVTSFSVISE